MNKLSKPLFAILIIVGSMSTAHAVTKEDFAYGYSIEVDGDGAIYSLYLNDKIYQGMTREDRGDLRIFNSLGEIVPHDIRRAEKMTKKRLDALELPYFPIYKTDPAQTINMASTNVHITTNDQGAIIDLNYGKSTSIEKKLAAYIIDASSLESSPDELSLDWESDNENFILDVRLEGSDDLNHWRSLAVRTTLSKMQWKNHALIKRKIDLPTGIPKYLRISWDANKQFKINTVKVHFPETYHAQERQWSVFLPSDVDKKNRIYYFNTQAVLPIDRLNVQLPTKNSLVNVSIESSSSKDGPWFARYHGLLYDLQFDQSRLQNSDVHPRINSHRFWRIQVLNGEGDFSGDPQLRLGWIAEQLLFLASGQSPFTLTYGSARVERNNAPLSQLLSETTINKQGTLIKSAKLGAAIDFGDSSRLQPEKPPVDWKQYSLWAILLVAVLLLGIMAFRLYKQMDQANSEE